MLRVAERLVEPGVGGGADVDAGGAVDLVEGGLRVARPVLSGGQGGMMAPWAGAGVAEWRARLTLRKDWI